MLYQIKTIAVWRCSRRNLDRYLILSYRTYRVLSPGAQVPLSGAPNLNGPCVVPWAVSLQKVHSYMNYRMSQ